MNKKTIPLLALSTAMLITSALGIAACKKASTPEEEHLEDYVVNGTLLTVNKACTVRYEAENVDTSGYVISSDNEEKIVERDDASGGKFLAAATGDTAKAGYFTFNVNLQFNTEFTMTVAYAQTENRKGNDMDMTKSYSYLIDENKSVHLDGDNAILAARDDITEWQEITYESETLPQGMHSFRVTVAENTGKGNPNIDYFEFDFTEVDASDVTGISVPENDFHTPVQYAYIHDEENLRKVSVYAKGVVELSRPNAINLDYSYLGKASSYAVEYADNANFNDSVTVKDIQSMQYGVYNLKLGQDLYWRAATSESGLASAKVNSMTIAYGGPRNLFVDGVSNVRDLGGYESSLVSGARINQGLYFRGANLESVTDAGKAEMLRLGIRTEIDMRDSYQCKGPYVDGIAYYPESIPSGTEPTRFEAFADVYKEIFTLIAEADNAPIYLHCTAGADRTGIVSFMLLTVCGANYDDIVRDYLFTNFSVQGERKIESEFDNWWSKLDNFGKATKADNAKAWLMSKGISEGTVEHIREIFVEGYEATVPYNPSTPVTPVDPTPETPTVPQRPADPVLKITQYGKTRFEAEKANLGGETSSGKYYNWPTATAYNDIAIQSGTSSSGKFLAAATGGKEKLDGGEVYLTFKINLQSETEADMIAAFAQTKSAVPNLTFTVTVDGKKVTAKNKMSNKGVGVWQEITYELGTLAAGDHAVKLVVNYDTANQGNPNIDYFDFDLKDPNQTVEPPVIELPAPDVLVVNEAGEYTMEAENTVTDNYQISGDNATKAVDRADASGGKFLAAASGSKVGINTNYVTFTLKLETDAKVTLSMAVAQTESKKGNAQDIAKTFGINIAGGDLALTSKTSLAARDDITQWETFTYDPVLLEAGTYTVKLYVKANTGKGVPNIDFFKVNVEEATLKESKIRVEAETANLGEETEAGKYANWLTAGAYNNVAIQNGEGASDGKFLAAATGGKANLDAGKATLTFKLTLEEGSVVQMKAAYAQTDSSKVPNLTFTITIDGVALTASQKMENSGKGVWQVISYDALLLAAGEHEVKLVVNYDTANQGNPNIDYFEFDVLQTVKAEV